MRPNNRSNGKFICPRSNVPRISSEYELIHPPCVKLPLVSSSGPPGACMMPSREICSSTIIFLMTEFFQCLGYYEALYFQRSRPTAWLTGATPQAERPVVGSGNGAWDLGKADLLLSISSESASVPLPYPGFHSLPHRTGHEVCPHPAHRQPSPCSFQGLTSHIPLR
jgi:hypothetical protein